MTSYAAYGNIKSALSLGSRANGVKVLVWFEAHESRESAFQRERQLKKWNRAWKLELIERSNPEWKDLASELTP
jgi:putative endonuclease